MTQLFFLKPKSTPIANVLCGVYAFRFVLVCTNVVLRLHKRTSCTNTHHPSVRPATCSVEPKIPIPLSFLSDHSLPSHPPCFKLAPRPKGPLVFPPFLHRDGSQRDSIGTLQRLSVDSSRVSLSPTPHLQPTHPSKDYSRSFFQGFASTFWEFVCESTGFLHSIVPI